MPTQTLATEEKAPIKAIELVEAKPVREIVDPDSGKNLAWEFEWNTGEREFLFADDFNHSIIFR